MQGAVIPSGSSPESGNRPKDSELASCRWLGFHVLVTTGKLAVRVEGPPLPRMAAPTYVWRKFTTTVSM
jgi:hypothetical protein